MPSPTDGYHRLRYMSKALLGLGITVVLTLAGVYLGIDLMPL